MSESLVLSAPMSAGLVMSKTISIIDDSVVEPCEQFIAMIHSDKFGVLAQEMIQINDDESFLC